jgi:hypothetical protein
MMADQSGALSQRHLQVMGEGEEFRIMSHGEWISLLD